MGILTYVRWNNFLLFKGFIIFSRKLFFSTMAWTYILYSKKINKFYVGAFIDLNRRLYEHNIGHSKFTSTGTPWELVYQEQWGDLISAKRRESEIKKKKSRKFIEELIKRSVNP
jgi:putative endonuclease